MPNAVRAIPEGYHTVTPYLTCKNSAQAIDFYKSVFGAKEIMRMAGPDGKIGHAEIQIGDSHIMLADEFPGMSSAPTPGAKNPCGLGSWRRRAGHARELVGQHNMGVADLYFGVADFAVRTGHSHNFLGAEN